MINGSIGAEEVKDFDGRRLFGWCWDLVASSTSDWRKARNRERLYDAGWVCVNLPWGYFVLGAWVSDWTADSSFTDPLGPLGFERAQHRQTLRPAVDGTPLDDRARGKSTSPGPLGPLGFNFSQHGPTTRPSVERTAEKAFRICVLHYYKCFGSRIRTA